MSRKSSTDDYRFKSCMFCKNGDLWTSGRKQGSNLEVSVRLYFDLHRSRLNEKCGAIFSVFCIWPIPLSTSSNIPISGTNRVPTNNGSKALGSLRLPNS